MAHSTNIIKSIAIVGASGNVGTQAVRYLLAANRFNITIISRADSTATFPNDASITVKRGAYNDTTFLASALQDQEVLILALGFMAMGDQASLISAAVDAGVEWILPTEYAGDGLNDAMVNRVPLFWPKREARQQISKLSAEKTGGKTKWIGVASNPWVPFSIQTGMFKIDPWKKAATLFEDAGNFNVSTIEQIGRGIAKLLALPVGNEADRRSSLEYYANNFVYISSALTTQRELFASALNATGTAEADWTVSHSSCRERLRVAEEKFAAGDMLAGADGTYAVYMGEGLGGDYEAKAKEDREVLGLEVEDVDAIVKQSVELGPFSVM